MDEFESELLIGFSDLVQREKFNSGDDVEKVVTAIKREKNARLYSGVIDIEALVRETQNSQVLAEDIEEAFKEFTVRLVRAVTQRLSHLYASCVTHFPFIQPTQRSIVAC